MEKTKKIEKEMSKTLLERAYTIRDEVSEAANSAYRVGQLLVDMLLQLQRASGDYLSSVRDSVANGHITFEKGATVRGGLVVEDGASLKGGATFGDYVGGMLGGRGGKIDEHGNGELERLTIRGSLQTAELLINRITAIEGDWLMTESGTVERVRYDGDRHYRLWLRRRWDNDFTAFAPQDVLKGVVNTLAARALGREVGEDAVGKYATSWMLVRDVDLTDNSIGVELYVDDANVIPGGKNFAPVVGMNLARWGNVQNKTRQSCLYLSSREGRIVHLNHVDRPILSDSDVMSSFGSVPEFLQQLLGDVLSKQEDYVFARGLIVQDIIRLGADSQPLAEVVDRGLWRSDASYYHKSRNAESGVWEISEVWHGGSKWRCMVDSVGVVPGAGVEWELLQAAPRDGERGENGLTPMPNLLLNSDLAPRSVSTDMDYYEGFTWRAEIANGGIISHEPGVSAPHAGAKVVSCESFVKSTDYKDVPSIASVYQVLELVAGVTYTFSVYVKGADAGWMIAWPIDGTHFKISGAQPLDEGRNTSEGWKRYAVTFTARVSGVTNIYLRSWSRDKTEAGGKVYFSCPKLEESYRPTPWTRAQEDFRGERGERGQAGRDGVAAQANMLLGTDFKGAFAEKEVAGKWYKRKSAGTKFGDAHNNSSLVSPVFGTKVAKISAFYLMSNTVDEWSELVYRAEKSLIVGKQYVFSVYAKCVDARECKFWLVGWTGGFQTAFVAGRDWERFSFSFVASSASLDFGIRVWNRKGDKPDPYGIFFAAPKLEEGTVATPWCLAEEDKKGERGGMLRPRGLWSELKDGVQFESGGESDFVDVVTVGAGGGLETYYCTERHTKSADKKPSANSAYWRKGDSFELVSTRYALIGDATVDSAVVRQLRTAPEGYDRVVSVGAEQRTYAAGNAYPSIVQGFRQEGDKRIAVLEFYDGKTGDLLYNLGPNGIFSALNKVGNKWTEANVIYVGEPHTATVLDLLEWVEKEKYPTHYEMPRMSRPEYGQEGETMDMYTFGKGVWFEEGYTVLNNVGAGGASSRLYNVSRRGTPLYANKRLYMWSSWMVKTLNEDNYAPSDLFKTVDGFENGNVENLVPRDGWYLSRENNPVTDENYRFWDSRLNRSLDLKSLEVFKIRDGVFEKRAKIYFAREDAYPRAGERSTAEYGRYNDGTPQEELIMNP